MGRTQGDGQVLTIRFTLLPSEPRAAYGPCVTMPFSTFKGESLKMFPPSVDGFALIYPFRTQPSLPPKAAPER